MTGKFEKSEKEPLMDSNRLERKKRIERNRKRRLYRNVNNLMYAGIFVMAAIITIAAAVSRNNKIEYVDTAQMASTESIRVNNSNTDKVAAKAEETTKKSKKKRQLRVQQPKLRQQQSLKPLQQGKITLN